jgi:hypothetical protein
VPFDELVPRFDGLMAPAAGVVKAVVEVPA